VTVERWQRQHAGMTALESIPGAVEVLTPDRRRLRLPFDEVWGRTHNRQHSDDVWVVGFCADVPPGRSATADGR
jgi:hypothetical protein